MRTAVPARVASRAASVRQRDAEGRGFYVWMARVDSQAAWPKMLYNCKMELPRVRLVLCAGHCVAKESRVNTISYVAFDMTTTSK